ncbi:VOC family protein [Anoxybacillus rupiensis]|jgi:catechol 2,3-dioxygenase|uniref:VOC family protein n=1 Tax=Anoxybacteroides rupiense TaxID=311460 RepID=A0ABT5W805_9BACL|nr:MULTISPECIES: VOC family protein [Anoxybacillus]KXG10022.1 Catechol-2,3-dioxygenase [Anoxybacillus sp. P3H1B]MDE8564221.1 VOC family protein [Anoxybacillus rupiensis]QHC03115.1 glyoxalase [Anoxybacillus sp. PDR2]
MRSTIHPKVEIGHVHLRVAKLDRSIHFYTKWIGLQLLEQKGNLAVLTADGITRLIVLEESSDTVRKPPRTTGLYHFAILVPDRSTLARVLLHLLKVGYPLQGASDHQFSEAVYLADPDGNGIEIYADRPREQWEKAENGEYKGVTESLDVEGLLAEADHAPWTGLPPKTKMGHIHLHVAHMHEAEQFYHQGLGFDITIRMDNHALFVSAGGYHHHIGLNTWIGVGAPKPPENALGLRLFSIVFPHEKELEKAIESLKAIGAKVEWTGTEAVTVDPFGNRIQLRVQKA